MQRTPLPGNEGVQAGWRDGWGGLVAGTCPNMPLSRWCVYIPERPEEVGGAREPIEGKRNATPGILGLVFVP